ncbi:hypothetical protein yberc0001_25190 [Yersinia bercovieri ATCC 43970]|uniref:Uncharacterized protein n=1 Tax=Yersinia bercovieri ATCC 43970 TaxID=349968 RepID=A0ABM9XUY4_YERBE|nr:hypothetical protein yberc0001_25190 [Yersinia bercovieri ATCC 43970]
MTHYFDAQRHFFYSVTTINVVTGRPANFQVMGQLNPL